MPFLFLAVALLAASTEGRLLWTAAEAAKRLSISTDSLYDLVRRGQLPFVRVGRRMMIEESELEAFVAARRKRVRSLAALLNDDDPVSAGPSVTTPADAGDGHDSD